ncbi:MAG: hypothetical protein MUQ10_13440 [Anaerolineae bacterium]|nr:hypothetical protein [Anaerolineae bacterium]
MNDSTRLRRLAPSDVSGFVGRRGAFDERGRQMGRTAPEWTMSRMTQADLPDGLQRVVTAFIAGIAINLWLNCSDDDDWRFTKRRCCPFVDTPGMTCYSLIESGLVVDLGGVRVRLECLGRERSIWRREQYCEN